MKNKKTILLIIIYLPITLLLPTFQSCEQFVEIDLPDDQINTEDVFKDIKTTKAALVNLYTSMREAQLFKGGSNGINLDLSKYTDDLDAFTESDQMYNNNISPSGSPSDLYWTRAFKNIYDINAFINGLNMSEYISENDKEVFLGEAYFLRALYYQKLTLLFGNIPYITSTDYKANTTVSKINTDEVLSLIKQDLIKARQLLPNEYRNPERFYPNKPVAELVLAQTYLLQKQYKMAEQTAKTILNNSFFKIESDLDKVFKKDAASTLWQLSSNSSSNFAPTADASTYIFASLPPTNYALSTNFIAIFDGKDLRNSWIKEVTNGTVSYFHAYKYKNKENNADEYAIVFRIEEAYFVLMEALAYQNQIPEAVYYLNLIRQRAGLDPLSENLSKESFIDEMLSESRREFFTEGGHRFFDLKRNDRLHLLKMIKPNWQDKHALLPIPESETLLNPNLLPQNEGY